MSYKHRFFKAPDGESFFLFGHRGIGKTTWLKHEYPNALWIDFLNPRIELQYAMFDQVLESGNSRCSIAS